MSKPHNPHILRGFISFTHYCGLMSVPNFYKEPWKNRFHGYYSTCVTIIMVLWAISTFSSVFRFAVNDLGEFLMRFWENILIVTAYTEWFYVRLHMRKFFEILNMIESLKADFGHHRSLPVLHQRQRWFQNFAVVGIWSMVFSSRILLAFAPQKPEDIARAQRIYNLNHPQRTLPLPMYIPGVDTSDMNVFVTIFFLGPFLELWLTLIITMTITFFSFLAHDIQMYTDICAEYTRLIGEQHRNENGELIFYTNLEENEYVVRGKVPRQQLGITEVESIVDTDEVVENQIIVPGKNQTREPALKIKVNSGVQTMRTVDHVGLVTRFERDKDFYDFCYVKQVISFQRKLDLITEKVYEFYYTTLKIRATLAIIMIIVAVLILLYPTQIPLINRLQVNGEAIGMTGVFVLFFYSGELVAECNLTLRSAAYCSGWYKCSNKTRMAVCLFLTRNQNMNYFEIFKVMRLEYDLMVRIFKAAYACLNLMISQSAKLNH